MNADFNHMTMPDSPQPQDDARERKRNTRLAIAVGGIAMSALALFYISLFLVMIFRPGLLFSIMPFPDIATSALSDGNRTYLLSQRPDLSNISFGSKQQPEMRYFVSLLEGTEQGRPLQIEPYARAVGGLGRLVFLYPGGYRSFDGASWFDTRSGAIGQEPEAVLTPEGLFVLSTFDKNVHLYRITEHAAIAIPLPHELFSGAGDASCSCGQLFWSRGSLGLFWSSNESISWTSWNGQNWTPLVTWPFKGRFQVIADDSAVYFFSRLPEGPASPITLTVFANSAWSTPVPLQPPGGSLGWDVFMQQGRPMLLTRQLTSQTLYTVVDSALSEPVRVSSLFNLRKMLPWLAVWALAPQGVLILVIFGFSALIDRYKNRFRTVNNVQYEYASLFRRFAAHLIDTLLTLLPFAVAVALFFHYYAAPSDNLFLTVLVMLITVFFFVLAGYLYHSLFEGLYGATPGKRLCGIVVLRSDFTPCSLGAGFLRNLLRIVDSFFYYLVAAVALAGTLHWQRLGDLVAETIVVRRPRPGAPAAPPSAS